MFVDESHTEKQVLQYFNLLLTKTRKKTVKRSSTLNNKWEIGNKNEEKNKIDYLALICYFSFYFFLTLFISVQQVLNF